MGQLESSIFIDPIRWKEIKTYVLRPKEISNFSSSSLFTEIDRCLHFLKRLRMGGRSASLVFLSLLLWHGKDRLTKEQINVEELLALGFRIAGDPSFVQPEMGLILVGILGAKYKDFVKDPEKEGEQIWLQTKLMLDYFATKESSSNPVSAVAWVLSTSWEDNREIALQEAVAIMKNRWPSTSAMKFISKERAKNIFGNMGKKLPIYNIDIDRTFYRLWFEYSGLWEIVEGFKLE